MGGIKFGFYFSLILFFLVGCGEAPSTKTATRAAPPPDPELSSDISSMNFGSLMMESTSASQTVTITNTTSTAATGCKEIGLSLNPRNVFFLSSSSCPEDSFEGNGTCIATVYSKPSRSGTLTGKLYYSCEEGGDIIVELSVKASTMLSRSSSSLSFDPVLINGSSVAQDFVITNDSTETAASGCSAAELSLTDAASFTISNDTCGTDDLAAGASCTISLKSIPTAVGATVALLTRTCSVGRSVTLALAGAGVNFSSSVSTVEMGTIYTNVTTSASALTVTNASGVEATLCSDPTFTGTDAASFSVDASSTCLSNGTMSDAETCTIVVNAAPTTAKSLSATLNYSCGSGGALSIPVTATSYAAAIAVSPTSKSYGDVFTTGSSTAETFTVSNSTTATISSCSNPSLTGTHSGEFVITGGTCSSATTLTQGQSCTILVTSDPTTTGSKSASLNFSCVVGGSLVIPLTSSGVELGNSNAAVDFGDILVGNTSSSSTITVSNSSSVDATLCAAPALAGADSAEFSIVGGTCGAGTLSASSSCTILVNATPASAVGKSASVSYTCGGGASITSSLAATGVDVNLGMLPASFDFTDVWINSSSTTQTFTITNSGTAAATSCSSAVLSGANSSEFTITGGTCGVSDIGVSSSCTVIVESSPLTAGAKAATVSRTCTQGGTVSSTLAATAVNVAVDQGSYDFSNVLISTTSANQTFTFSNASSLAATSCTLSLTGSDSAHFSLDLGLSTCDDSATLAAAGSCQAVVAAAPTTTGSKSARLLYDCTSGPTVSSALSATGTSAALSFGSSTYDFGEVFTLKDSSNVVFTLTNTGTATATGCSAASLTAGDFSIVADTCGTADLLALGTCSITVKGNPPSDGAVGVVTLSRVCTVGGTGSIDLSMTGVSVTMLPLTNNFGPILVGQSAGTQNFTFTNNSTVLNATGCSAPSLSNATDFSITSDACSTNALNAAQSCIVTVEAIPQSTGSKTATLSRTCTSNGTTTTTALGLSTFGLYPNISFGPSSYDFSEAFINVNSATTDITLTNSGDADATNCSAPSLTNTTDFTITADTCGVSDVTSGGGTCTVTIRTNPTATGAASSTLSRICTVGGTPTASITATGVSVSLSPLTHDFGTVSVPASAGTQGFVFTNNATTLNATGCSAATNSNTTDFSITGDTCTTADLAATGSCTITVDASPQSIAVLSTTIERTCTSTGSISTTANQVIVEGVAKKISLNKEEGGILYGTEKDDLLIGNFRAREIWGGPGNDKIIVGYEKKERKGKNADGQKVVLWGGAGADEFVIDFLEDKKDCPFIMDFNKEEGDYLTVRFCPPTPSLYPSCVLPCQLNE